MFDRFVRLAQARMALREDRFEQVLRLLEDPLVRDLKKAEVLRVEALAGLVGRARRRLEAGHRSAALVDCERALAAVPDDPAARELETELRERTADAASRAAAARDLCRDARRSLERGDVAGARAIGTAAGGVLDGPEVRAIVARIEAQAARARASLEEAARARQERRLDDAVAALGTARALDHGLDGAGAEARALARAVAREAVARIEAAVASGGPAAGRLVLAREAGALPELPEEPAFAAIAARLEEVGQRQVRELLEAGELRLAVAAAHAAGMQDPMLAQIARAVELAEHGELGEAAAIADEVAVAARIPGLARQGAEWAERATAIGRELDRARSLAAGEGRLLEAREALLAVLERCPGHAAARRELDLLEQGSRDREEQLRLARELARDGDLCAAASKLVALTVPGPLGEEPRLLLRDVQQRMDTVQAGIRQVLRALHGRPSATLEGLEHCARRLEELGRIQRDAADLGRVQAAVHLEVEGLARLERAAEALARDDVEALGTELGTVFAERERLLSPGRLDARALEVADRVIAAAEQRLDGGWTRRAERLLGAIAAWEGVRDGVAARIAAVRERLGARTAAAAGLAGEARQALAAGDLAAAEDCLARAVEVGADEPEVMRAAEAVAARRRREHRLSGVEGLASARDWEGARRELERLGPTPSMMRTRIYDLKQSLARAQGLDGAFLLRVDEGGELLVVRGESVSIGNLRDGGADLPLLANLAGRHARLCRTLSFHGGQEDRVVAERGEVTVDGRPVDSFRLADRTRFRLGANVELEYRLPTERSLTALLAIRGGFQVAGSDRVLWMKDRGRDGRIVIGKGPEAHVVVDSATGEVEVFAGRDGQVRVACSGGGEIDGRPFQGEHPATAGAIVRAAGVTFVLLPWARP